MAPLKLAATSSLVALALTLGADRLSADHQGSSGSGFGWGNQQQDTGPTWWQQQPAPRDRASRRNNEFTGWFQPQPELPRTRNIEPEAAPAKAPVIYTYRADPLVELAKADLARPTGFGMRFSADGRAAQAVHAVLQDGTSGMRVTEKQRDKILAFYSERNFAPVWMSGTGPLPRAGDVLAELARADEHGLVEQDYLPPELGSFTADLAALGGDQEKLARLDVALTAAALRYAMHASGGRIVPSRLSAYHDLTPPTVDAGEALARLASEQSPAAYLASLHPVHPAYEAFRREFTKLSAETDRGDAPIAEGPAIKPGGTDARLPAIRARLARLGHLAPAAASSEPVAEMVAAPIADTGVPLFGSAEAAVVVEVGMPASEAAPIVAEPVTVEPDPVEPTANVSGSDAYDEETVTAVKAFQAAAGLKVDGVIGQQTISRFNSGNTEERIKRLGYAMEQLRWMPRDFGAKHVLVNTASFETKVVENGATIWSSKVIVGTPENQTVFFSDQFETVVFNPYWGVPASIILNEMLPEIYRDPSYLDREGYEVTDLNGQVISSYGVDWYNLNRKNLPIGVRQPPGPSNALGELKFLFPNEHAIYMHDTPSKPLFAEPMRAYSHGCVRVQNPREFAEVILGWDQERIASTLATNRDYSVPVEQKIDVHITYFTAWPDETGAIRYFDDVYGRDQLLERALGTLTVAMQ